MIKVLKNKLISLLTWLIKDDLLSGEMSNIKFTDIHDDNSMAFNFVIGVDVSKMKDGKIGLHINNMMFASGNEIGKHFIQSTTPGSLRDTISLILASISRYVLQAPESLYQRMSIPTGIGDVEVLNSVGNKKIDPRDLN